VKDANGKGPLFGGPFHFLEFFHRDAMWIEISCRAVPDQRYKLLMVPQLLFSTENPPQGSESPRQNGSPRST